MFVTEQGIGQRTSSQPYSCSVDLEEAQHTLSSSLPVICLRIFCHFAITLLHARYALYDHEASPKGYHVFLPIPIKLVNRVISVVEYALVISVVACTGVLGQVWELERRARVGSFYNPHVFASLHRRDKISIFIGSITRTSNDIIHTV